MTSTSIAPETQPAINIACTSNAVSENSTIHGNNNILTSNHFQMLEYGRSANQTSRRSVSALMCTPNLANIPIDEPHPRLAPTKGASSAMACHSGNVSYQRYRLRYASSHIGAGSKRQHGRIWKLCAHRRCTAAPSI